MGTPQIGATLNNMWDTHLPNHTPTNEVKVIVYSKHTLGDAYIVTNNMSHPLLTLTSIILNIHEHNEILLRIVNIYHVVDKH